MSDLLQEAFARLHHQVLEHARHEYPREACGLLARHPVDGAIDYLPCTNTAPASAARDSFRIRPEDWAAVEDHHAVLAVVHSHPDWDAHPSDADRWMCHESGLPWFVIAVPGGAWTMTSPEPLPLLGRSFHHGIVDCYGLTRDYYRQELGIVLPNRERRDDWWEPGPNGEPGDDLYRKGFADAGFVELGLPAGRADGHVQPRLHDVLLMRIRAEQDNHTGVFIGPVHGVDCFIHHPMGGLSVREPWGGIWLRRCTGVFRHRSQL